MNSIWTTGVALPQFPTEQESSNKQAQEWIEGDLRTDVLIIGGGMAGILCAYFLQEQGVDYILVERDRIASGVTKNTTAKITSQHGLIYHKLLKNVGEQKAKMYLEANQSAVQKYVELCRECDCDFEEKTSFVYARSNSKKLENEAEALRRLGFSCQVQQINELPFSTAGAVAFPHQAQFHPLKFITAMAKNLNIYEHTFVKKLAPNRAITEHGQIRFQKLIFTTHFPIDNKHGLYFLKMYQDRSYVLALTNAPKINGMYVDENKRGMSFRRYKDWLLVGGGSHRTGKKGGNFTELREFAQNYYPIATEAYYWAAQDCMTLDAIPYIGPYSPHMSDCYVATGFNKWGMTSSMVAAMLLTDFVLEKMNPYAEVFCPSRNLLKPQLLLNGWEALSHLLRFSKKRCPHLGCALQWNAQERSWDCACHGSRFTEDGRLLDNPANGNLKK